MLKLNGILQNNDLKTEELVEYCKISKTNPNDIYEIARILCDNMGVNNPMFAVHQLIDTKVFLNESVKVYDTRDNKIYGLLILSDFPLKKGSPLNFFDNVAVMAIDEYSQVNGFMFILDERLRGKGYDKEMIKFAMDFIKTFDIIWVAVDKTLKSHNYWKHLGMYEILNIDEAIFYCKILNKNILQDIYRKMCFHYANNNK